MASSVAVRKGRKHKMRLMTDNSDDQMVVKSLSVPPGLETLMEGLTREVLRMQPQDICLFASEHFAKLIKMREAAGGEYQFCKTTIHDRIKQKNVVSSRVTTQQNQQPSPKDDVETLDGTPALSAPRLDFGRLTNGVSPEIKRNISEASTAEIDKLQAGFFNSKLEVNKSEEQGNTDDEMKEQEHGTITGIQAKENITEADDVKNVEPTEHNDDGGESSKTKIDDDGIKEVNEELAKSKENVHGTTGEEDNVKKENEIQEETKDDTVNDKEVCENIDKDAATKECTNEEEIDKQNEETSKEEATAHDACEEQETKNIANEVEPVNKENEEILDNIPEAKIEHLATAGKEAELNETEKKDSGNNVEDAESKLEATDEHDDLSDSNDVVTQETEIKTMSPADKVQSSSVEENTDEVSSVEEKPVPTNGTGVKPLEDSTEAKLVDENHEGEVEDKHNSMVENVQTDGGHNIRKQSVSQPDEHEVQSLTIPEISTTVATPTPSEDGSTSADNVAKEFDESVNLTEEKQIKAATKLQSLWRGYKLRKMQKSTPVDNADGNAEDLHKLTTAATVIQSLWRGYSFRKSKATENTTSADVENINSDETSPDKEVRDVTDEQNIAATKIQASWRGHNVRKKRHIDENDIASTEEHDKTVGEGKPGDEVVENESQTIAKEVMAATVIQALWRGYVTRKSRNLESANGTPQRNSDVDLGKLNLAAAKIQSLWRGHNSRKLTSSSRVVAEDEMHAKEMENISETREHEKAETTDATTAVSKSKTDTNIIESDKPDSEAEKVTEVTEPAVEAEKATETESEHAVQPSDSEGNAIVPELGSDKINDTVEPEIEAEKVGDVESGNIAETTDSEGNIEGVTASPKSDLEDEKTTEEVDSVSKTDADGPELQNETAKSEKTSDESNEITENNDEPKSEVQSEEIIEKSELVVKPEETKSEVEDEGEVKSEEVAEKTEPGVKAEVTEAVVKSEEVSQTSEPIIKADETEGEEKSEEVAEKAEPSAKADETEDEGKQEEVAEKIESAVKADKLEGEVKSEDDADKTEPSVKADETEDERKQEELAEKIESAVKADELEGAVKSEENAEKTEPSVKADETEDEEKQEEVTEKAEPAERTDETEAEVKSEVVSETSEPVIKTDETEGEEKSEQVAEKTEPAVKAEEIVKTDEDEGKSEENAEEIEHIVKADETEDDGKQEEVAEKIEPAVKADELEGEVKSAEVTENAEPAIKGDEAESEVKSEEVAEKTEPNLIADETENEVKSEEVSQTSEPVMKADETEGEVKSEVIEPVVKEEVNVETTEPKTKSDEFTETSESVVKPEEIVEATETDGEAKSENIAELAAPTESKDISEITENDVKPGEISEPEVKAEEIGDKVEPSVVDETTETGESSVSDKDVHGTINSSTTGGEEVTDLVEPDSTIVEPNEIANNVEPVLKTDEISEATASEAKDTDPEKTVESETDAERNLNEGSTAPVSENITQETAEKVEGDPTGTENENDTVEKTELHSDKEIDSAGRGVKETEETNAIDSNVKEINEAKTLTDSEKVSETDENEPAIIPGSENNTKDTENIEVKDADVTDKTEAGDNIEISVDSPDNTTITTPSEDTQSEVEHASAITKVNDNLSVESDATAENKEPESAESTDEGLNEQSTTITEDSTEEKSTKLDENTGVKPADVIVEDNAEQDKVANSSDNEEKNKDVTVNIDASDTTKTQGTKNTESDEKEQIDAKENVTETLSPHSLGETQGHVEKDDEITEPEIKKESVEADEASPSNQEECETEITNNIASDKSSEEEKMNETDEKSTNDGIIDIKDDNPSETAVSSEANDENKSDESEPEKKSTDDDQSLMKTENKDHVHTPTEVQCPQISNDDTSVDNGKQDVADEKVGLEDPVKENNAATKIQSTWRGYNVRKSNNIITDTKSEHDNETEDKVENSSDNTGSNTGTNPDEITKLSVDNAEKDVEELGTAKNNINETANSDGTGDKVEHVPVEAAKEISEPAAEKVEHSTVHSENINETGTNDASEIDNEKSVGDLTSVDENKSEDTGANHEAVPATKTAELETAEPVSDTIENKEDTSVSADETLQQEAGGQLEESSPNSTDNKLENAESGDKLEDDLEKPVETANVEHDPKLKEENVSSEVSDSRAEDHKDTYQASEASTVDIRDVEDSLKSPVEAEDSNDLEINVHEDGDKLNESSDTKNSLDADNKVKFYVGPDETNRIQIVDGETDNHVTESDKLAADEVTGEQNSEIHKSVTSVLLSALSNDSEELEKDEATKEMNEEGEHQNDGTNNASTVNSSVPNAEENSAENTEEMKENSTKNSEDLKENSTERNSGENINATQDNQDPNSIHNNIENHTLKSPENVSNIENDKSDANHDDDQQKLATNVENFDKALSESENKEKAANNVEVDADTVEDVTHKNGTEDTTSVADTQNASSIPLSHENTENTADTIEENNTAPLAEEQHAENSENKSESVQNETSDLSPTNLHVEESSESATKDSNDADTPVEQYENLEADEAATHTLLNTTAKDMAHISPSDIIEEGTHDKGNNEHESEETHKVLDAPGPTTTEETEILHEVENESPVSNEDKHSVDKVDNEPTIVEDGILNAPVEAIVENKPHESESLSSASVNDSDENKTVELDETHSPVVTLTEENQNEPMEHLEEKDADKNIEENETEKLDDTSVVPSTEDIKDNSNEEKSEHLEENINDVKKNSEENEHVAVDSTISAVEPASQDVSVENKENQQIDTTEDKDAKENINEESPVDKNENALISNKDTHSEVNDMKETNENEDKPDDEINIKDIESQIEHDTTDDDANTKQNNGVKENEGNNTVPEEKEVESSEGHHETSAAVTGEDNKTEEDKAAVKIQSAWKGYHVRQGLHEDKELATLQRPAECDELSSETNVAEDANVLSQAATTIQAGARGYLVRKRRHLAKLTDVTGENADSRTMDESASVSQETVIEKHAATLDTSQSLSSTEIAKSEEDNTHDGIPKEETQPDQEENKLTITPEGSKDVESNTADAGKSKADGESSTECRNDKDVKTECEKANVAESSREINESPEKHTQEEEETTNQKDEHEELDEIDALNQRLRHLNRSNVYQIDEEKEPNDKVEDEHKTNSPEAVKVNFDRALSDLHAQTSKSSDDDESVMTAPSQTDDRSNDDASKPGDDKELERKDKHSHEEPDTENKEVAQTLADPTANTTPRLSVNLDDFDSAKYDLKVEHPTPRSKNTSPVHELTSAAYKIGAAIAVDSETIVDAMDENGKDKSEAKPVEYIHIPLQGPLPEKIEEKHIEKETLKSSQEHGTSGKNKDDGQSPEYIYIPLKPPGTVDEEDEKVDEGSALKENVEDVDNQKKDVKNETDTIPQCPGESKDDNEYNLKERLSVSESAEEKEDSADTRAVLENKAKEDNNSNLKEHDLSGKEQADAKEIHESTTNHGIEEESDNETKQITKLPEPIPLMNNSSEVSSEAKSTEPDLSESKSPEPAHSEKHAEKSPEITESQPTHTVLSEEPIEKVTAEENLEKPSVSETKTPEPELSEFKPADSTVSGQSTDHLTTEDKSLVEHTSAEPELSENKSPETVLSDTKASDDKPKSPEAVDSEQVEKSKDETSHSPSLGKSTSPIDDIDAFLQRNKSRTISRQANVDASSHRTLFAEIDSLIDAYGQKRQMSPTSNDHPDLAAAKIDNESRAQGQQLSVQDDLPDVIMANSNGADRAATKIQSAYRGYHTRQQLLKEGANRLDEAQPRKGSQESDKTYTIDKRNGSTPDEEVSSDDDEMKNKAAAKIQTTFREYRKKRSIEHGKSKSEGKEQHANETGKDDENMEESVEQSNKVEEEPCPDETSEQEDQNKELKKNSEDTTSLVDIKDESVQENTSPSVSVNTSKQTTTHNTDGEEQVTDENPSDNSEAQQLHAADYDSLNSEPEKQHSPEVGLVQDLKIAKLEDKFLDHVVTNDSGTDAKHEQLRDISEITHGAATKIQSTYRGFKTRQTLKNNNQLDGSLETIPEVTSPTSQHREHATGADEQTINEEEHIPACTNGTVAQPSLKSGADVDDSSRPNSTTTVQKYKPTGDVVASTSDDWRYRLLQDATTDAESTVKDDTSSGQRSDEDDSDPYADSKLVQGYHHNQQHGMQHQQQHQQAEQPHAGLQHSGEMHDTLDIFLSSEELSQGAEVLTSRDTSTTDDVSGTRAQCESAAKHEAAEQHDDHSVMESAKHQSNKNNTPHNHQQQQHQQQQQQQQQTGTEDMGNDEAVAATKIQAGFRGYQVRKQMKLKKNGSDDAKMVKRCSSGRRRGSLRRGDNSKSGTDLEERSATKIQAGIRGFLVRKRQKSTKDKQ